MKIDLIKLSAQQEIENIMNKERNINKISSLSRKDEIKVVNICKMKITAFRTIRSK